MNRLVHFDDTTNTSQKHGQYLKELFIKITDFGTNVSQGVLRGTPSNRISNGNKLYLSINLTLCGIYAFTVN